MPTTRCFVATVLLAASLSGDENAFRKVVIDPDFRSEGVTVCDVNRDGKPDIVAGNLWYEAPDWNLHEIAAVVPFERVEGYSNSFLNFAFDMDADGWCDQIVFGYPGREAVWRQNPRGERCHWKEYPIAPNAIGESPAFANLFANRPPTLVFAPNSRTLAWHAAGAAGFAWHVIGGPPPGASRIPTHGLGVGDVSGDGRPDVLTPKGYWEGPADALQAPWRFVPANLGPDSAQMYAYDVNGDGLPDVLSSSAHNRGVWWYEQRRTEGGTYFLQHVIDDSFSQSHALVLADINGDGLMDVVTGKRLWAHGRTGDVDPDGACVLHWFELRRDKRNAEWIRHSIESNSGVGTQFVVADVNGDRLPDVVAGNKNGVFLFVQDASRRRRY